MRHTFQIPNVFCGQLLSDGLAPAGLLADAGIWEHLLRCLCGGGNTSYAENEILAETSGRNQYGDVFFTTDKLMVTIHIVPFAVAHRDMGGTVTIDYRDPFDFKTQALVAAGFAKHLPSAVPVLARAAAEWAQDHRHGAHSRRSSF